MDPLFTATNYLRYRLTAQTPHGIHSPFVFDFQNDVLLDQTPYYAFDLIESVRASMLLSDKSLTVSDFGAGGSKQRERQLRIKDIASRFVLPKKYGQLLFRMVNRFQPETILELGTSLGITSLYLALPKLKAKMITLEGCPQTAEVAKENFRKMNARHIELLCGEFTGELPNALDALQRIDFAYIDGNHRYHPTMDYFQRILPYCHPETVLVFDDIRWSRQMSAAWDDIKKHPAVTQSIDLFKFGIVFFRQGTIKQDFTLKF